MTRLATRGAAPELGLEQQVRARVASLSYLPTAAAVAMKLVELGRKPEAEPSEYVRVISSDIALCSKLLSLANSSWFGVRYRVTKPQVAVNLLGLGTVRTLAITYCLTGLHNDLHLTGEESRMFWSASLCKAVVAREYASRHDPAVAEEAFAAGLLQDFALPIMYAVARPQMMSLLQDSDLSVKDRLGRDRDLFRMDHAQIARIVAQKLQLPELFIDAVAFHHDRRRLSEMGEGDALADAIYVASLFPHTSNVWNPQDADQLTEFLSHRAPPMDVRQFLDAVQRQFNQLYEYFEQGKVPDARLADLLEQATREAADNTTRLMGTVHELLQQAASAGQEVHQLLKQHTQLEEAAVRDPLTGALNRDGFTSRANELLSRTARCGAGLAVVYLDIDRFKQLNDTFGHACGDGALRQVVATMRESVRQTDLVARLGGDEFLVMLGDCREEAATGIIERIVSRVATLEIGAEQARSAKATLSAGFLWVAPDGMTFPLETLLSTADRLMYEAKRSGGNRICKGSTQRSAATAV